MTELHSRYHARLDARHARRAQRGPLARILLRPVDYAKALVAFAILLLLVVGIFLGAAWFLWVAWKPLLVAAAILGILALAGHRYRR